MNENKTCPNCTRFGRYIEMDEEGTHLVCSVCGLEMDNFREVVKRLVMLEANPYMEKTGG